MIRMVLVGTLNGEPHESTVGVLFNSVEEAFKVVHSLIDDGIKGQFHEITSYRAYDDESGRLKREGPI